MTPRQAHSTDVVTTEHGGERGDTKAASQPLPNSLAPVLGPPDTTAYECVNPRCAQRRLCPLPRVRIQASRQFTEEDAYVPLPPSSLDRLRRACILYIAIQTSGARRMIGTRETSFERRALHALLATTARRLNAMQAEKLKGAADARWQLKECFTGDTASFPGGHQTPRSRVWSTKKETPCSRTQASLMGDHNRAQHSR